MDSGNLFALRIVRTQKAGVEGFLAHDIRRSTITHMLDAGVDVLTVQQLAGHADASTTFRYDRQGEKASVRRPSGWRFRRWAESERLNILVLCLNQKGHITPFC